jgi:hypothetical protein
MVNNTPVLLMNRLSFKSRNRNEVVRAFNGAAYESGVNGTVSITPFRAVNNAGDILGRKNYSCGGPNQVSNSKRRSGLVFRNSKTTSCDASGVEGASCNPKYVYDSSMYSKFKRQVAVQRSFTDTSTGCSNNCHVSALKRVRG